MNNQFRSVENLFFAVRFQLELIKSQNYDNNKNLKDYIAESYDIITDILNSN